MLCLVLSDSNQILIKGRGLSPEEVETALRVFNRSFRLVSVAIRKHGGT